MHSKQQARVFFITPKREIEKCCKEIPNQIQRSSKHITYFRLFLFVHIFSFFCVHTEIVVLMVLNQANRRLYIKTKHIMSTWCAYIYRFYLCWHVRVLRPKYSWNPMSFQMEKNSSKKSVEIWWYRLSIVSYYVYIDIAIGRPVKCLTVFFF